MLTLSSGVQGFTTIHSSSARQALSRLRFICQLADAASDLRSSALTSLVSEAVDIVVQCSRSDTAMRVTEVLAVEDLQNVESVAFSATPMFIRVRHDAPLAWTGNLPVRAARALELAGFDVRQLVGPT